MYRACLERFSVYVECIEVDFQNHGIGQRFVRKDVKTWYKSSNRAVGYPPHLERDFYLVVLLAHVPGTRVTLGRISMTIRPYWNSLATLQWCDKRPENNLRWNIIPCRLCGCQISFGPELASRNLATRRSYRRETTSCAERCPFRIATLFQPLTPCQTLLSVLPPRWNA